MTLQDAFGYQLSLDAPAALAPWEQTISAFLAHSAATPKHLAETLETRYKAPANAHLVREAASVYRTRDLLRRD